MSLNIDDQKTILTVNDMDGINPEAVQIALLQKILKELQTLNSKP